MAMTRTAMPETSIHEHSHAYPMPNKIGRAGETRRTAPSRDTMRTQQSHEPLLRARVSFASNQAHDCSTSLGRENVGHVRLIMLYRHRVKSSKRSVDVIGLLAIAERGSYSAS